MSGNSGCDGRSVGRKDYSSIDNNNKHNGLTMKSTIYTTIGASNHSDTTREEHDFSHVPETYILGREKT